MIRGVVEGVLAAVCFIYALQTRILYPKWMLDTLDHPWVLLLAVFVACTMYPWSPVSTVCSLLIIIAFVADIFVFTRKPIIVQKSFTRTGEEDDSRIGGTDGIGGSGGSGGPRQDALDLSSKWWVADGDIVVREDDTWLKDTDMWGPPLAVVPLAEPKYPTFHGLRQVPAGPGPAPFHEFLG